MKDEKCRFRPPKDGALVIWEITDLCNLECLHCCTNSSPREDTSEDLNTEQAVSVAQEFANLGVKEVYLTGGEVFTRRDAVEIISAIDTNKITVFVATNGIALTENIVSKLAKLNIKRLTISLDGHTAEVHNRVRVNPFAFQRTIEGIKNCVRYNIPVRISHVLTSNNIDYIEDMMRFVSGLGVGAIVMNTIVPVGRAKANEWLHLKNLDTDALERRLKKLKGTYTDISLDYSFGDDTSNAPKGCPAGDSLIHITSNGDVSPCSWLYKINPSRFSLGNLKEKSLQACLNDNSKVMNPTKNVAENCPIPYILKSGLPK